MTLRLLRTLTTCCFLATGGLAHATIVVWTNTAGGSWNAMTNWSPNQLPVSGDDVVITNAGTYTVTNSTTSLTLDSLLLGGAASGIQTLTASVFLELTNASMIASNGVLNWAANSDLEGSLTVAAGGTLTLSNNIYFSEFYSTTHSNIAALTNYGIVICAANIYGIGNSHGYGGGLINNAGTWQMVSSFINNASNTFINSGTLQQSGAGNSSINWNFSSTGAITTTGTMTLNWFGPSTLNGYLTLASSTILAPLTVASNAVLNLTGGDLEGSIMVLQGGTLTISNLYYFTESNYLAGLNNIATLTNYGTVICAASIESAGNSTNHTVGGIIYNAGLWQSAGAIGIASYFYLGINTFINTGTLEQISAGTTTIGWTFYNNGGNVSTPLGSFDMTNWLGTGVFYGSPTLSGGTISGTLAPGNLLNFSAGVNGALIISSNAQANWNGGDLEGSITVLQGGVLTISNGVYVAENNNNSATKSNTATLTNYGTVIWAGTIYGYGNTAGQGGGLFVNAGLWDAVTATSMANQSYPPNTNTFINTGTLEQTGGNGSVGVVWNFYNNDGTLTTAGGAFNIGNWLGSGLVYGSANFSQGTLGGTLAPGFVANITTTTINGAVTVSSNAQINWNGGDLEGSLTIMPGGTLTIASTLYFSQNNNSSRSNTATMTNFGTVLWSANVTGVGNGSGLGGGLILNAGLWDSVADNNTIGNQSSPSNTFINTGTLEKTAGTGASTISWNFISTGFIKTLSGTFALDWAGPSTLNGNLTLSQATITTPLTIASNAVVNLSSGDLESSLTILQGGTLTISNTFYFSENNSSARSNIATLTNFGTVILAGNIYGYGNNAGTGGGLIDNAGLWDFVTANTFYNQASPSNVFINTGTLEQTGGVGVSAISWYFLNAGQIETPVGEFALNWFGPSTVQGNFTLASGTISVPLTIASNALMNLAGGDLEGSMTVLQGGTLTISNTLYFAESNYLGGLSNTATLTNFGTVLWGGTIDGSGSSSNHAGGGIICNAGLWVSVAANQMGTYVYAGTNTFFNSGTLEQTGGAGTTTINWNIFNNGGVIGSQTNTLTLAGSNNLMGGTLNFGLNSSTKYGIITLSGNPAPLTGSVSVNLNNGYVPATGASFPVLTYTSETGSFTNFNLPSAVAWQTNLTNSSLTLTVLNVRPTLAPLVNQTIDELTALTVYPSASDPDAGQALTFALPSAPVGMIISPNTGVISWTPAQTESPSTNTILVSVTDNGTPPLSATNSFQVVVVEVNQAPILPLVSHVGVNEQTLLTVSNTAVENNIHAVTTGYGLIDPPLGMSISANGVITWVPVQSQSPGAYFITTVVSNTDAYDVVNPTLTATNTITVVVNEINTAPTLSAIPEQTVDETTMLVVTNAATDADIHATLSYSLLGAPTNMNISSSGLITWTPAQTQSPSTNIITTVATATDPLDMVNPQLNASNTFTVVVTEVNVAPVLPTIPTQTISELKVLTVTNTATESNIHATNLAYGLVSAPANMIIDSNGVITWTPTQSQSPSTNVITTVVTNTDLFDAVTMHLTATNTFTVIVNEANEAPILPSIANTNISVLTLLMVTNTASDADIHTVLSYALIEPPAGASIDSNGILTWTPAQSQSPSTNMFTVVAISTDLSDTIDPYLASISSFLVAVHSTVTVPLTLGSVTLTANQAQIQVNGPVGSNYTLQASSTLATGSWTNLLTNTPVSSPFTLTDTNAGSFNRRFYRVQLGP